MGCIPGQKGTNACYRFQPGNGEGVSVEFTEYPQNVIRTNGSYNIPGREGSVVMYGLLICMIPLMTLVL